MNEKFKPIKHLVYKNHYLIPGYSRYAISKTGEVIILINTTHKQAGEIINTSTNKHIGLHSDELGYRSTSKLVRLMCLAFYGLPPSIAHRATAELNKHITDKTVSWCFNKRGNLDIAIQNSKKGKIYYYHISTGVIKVAPSLNLLAPILNVTKGQISNCLIGCSKVIHNEYLVSRNKDEDWIKLLNLEK